jgi:hypothetical protein
LGTSYGYFDWIVSTMATRQQRLAGFNHGTPPADQPLELLCEDHCGTFVLPFPCHWSGAAWRNSVSGAAIDSAVVGWRTA